MLTSCRVGSAVPSSARGIDGGPRRFTEVVLTEQCSGPFWLLELRVSRHFSTFYDPLGYPGGCGGDGQPAHLFISCSLCALGNGLDVSLDELPLA